LNTAHKYVVTARPVDGPGADTTSALGDRFLEDITELKVSGGDKELQVHGSIQLARTLHEAGLVDIYRFLIAPVTVGPGAGLFDGSGPSYKMNVQHGVVTDNGVFDVEMTPEQMVITQMPTVRDGKDVVEEAQTRTKQRESVHQDDLCKHQHIPRRILRRIESKPTTPYGELRFRTAQLVRP